MPLDLSHPNNNIYNKKQRLTVKRRYSLSQQQHVQTTYESISYSITKRAPADLADIRPADFSNFQNYSHSYFYSSSIKSCQVLFVIAVGQRFYNRSKGPSNAALYQCCIVSMMHCINVASYQPLYQCRVVVSMQRCIVA